MSELDRPLSATVTWIDGCVRFSTLEAADAVLIARRQPACVTLHFHFGDVGLRPITIAHVEQPGFSLLDHPFSPSLAELACEIPDQSGSVGREQFPLTRIGQTVQ